MNLDLHFVHRIQQQAKTRANMTALRYKEHGLWRDISWKNFQEQLNQLSRALLAHNIGVQDKIAIFAHNMERWTIADIATLQIRAITVPIYATNTAQQAEFILNHADVKILFVGDQEQYDQALEIAHHCPKLQKIVAMKSTIQLQQDPLSCTWESFIETGSNAQQDELTQRLNQKQLSDLFTIIYTSGTTGNPKGVLIDYENVAYQFINHDDRLAVVEGNVSLSFLPLSHVYERMWVAYVLHKGVINCYLDDTNRVAEVLKEVRPHYMCVVPRLLEKIYTKIYENVEKQSVLKRLVFATATRIAKIQLGRKKKGKKK